MSGQHGADGAASAAGRGDYRGTRYGTDSWHSRKNAPIELLTSATSAAALFLIDRIVDIENLHVK